MLDRARSEEREVRERVVPSALTTALAGAIGIRDDTTGAHTRRLETLAVRLGEAIGLDTRQLDTDRER